MLIESDRLDDQQVIQTRLCIIGAGAAGITLAREFNGTKVDVCLLEGGGFEGDRLTKELYRGVTSGTFLEDDQNYLIRTRLRYFGGTTGHWTGWCRPLDPFDFEMRPWVPHSGWPFPRSHLEPFLQRAARVLQVEPFALDAASPAERPPFLEEGSEFTTVGFHMSPPTRFGRVYRKEIVDSENVRLILNAGVTDIETTESGNRTTQVTAKSLNGKTFHVQGQTFILAAGGIENARMLLYSDRVHARGLGNQHDLVGRFFMDHPLVTAGHVVLKGPKGWFRPFDFHRPPGFSCDVINVVKLATAAQRNRQLPNAQIYFKPPRQEVPAEIEEASGLFAKFANLADPPGSADTESIITTLRVRIEPLPNPESRVTLTNEKDAFGKPRVKLDWRVTSQDAANIRTVVGAFGRELGRLGRGRAQLSLTEEAPWEAARGGAHHMGTTRMHDDSKQGVVDRNCRLHGVSNLYVAGSSVFPAFGTSNPTPTLLALALRLADHLKQDILS